MSAAQAKDETDKKDMQVKAHNQLPTPQSSSKQITPYSSIINITPRCDATGNVVLKVGSDDNGLPLKSFLINRHAMCLASPVWEELLTELLSPEFSDRNIDEHGVCFPDGDPEAFEIALLVAHNQFHKLPKELDLQSLAHLAIFADRYELATLLKPFVTLWTNALPPPQNTSSWKFECQFSVAHVFGDRADAQAALKELVIHSVDGEEEALIWRVEGEQDREIDDECLPLEIFGSILEARSSLFNTLIDCAVAITWENVIQCKISDRERPENLKSANRCDLIVLGFVIMHLRQHEVMLSPYTRPEAKEELIASTTPFAFAQQLANLPVEYYRQHIAYGEHQQCLDHVMAAFQQSLDHAFEDFFEKQFLSEEDLATRTAKVSVEK